MNNRLTFLAFSIIFSNILLGQGGIPGNNRTGLPGQFLGYNTGTSGPLDIRNDFNDRINFFTNTQTRMFIDGGSGINGGRIAIGNNLPVGFVPQSRIHIHQVGNPIPLNSTYVRFTNGLTGLTATDGFAIGNSSSAFGPQGDVQLQQYEQAPLSIFLPNAANALTNYFHIQNTTGFTGINLNTPNDRLDVNAGNIDVVTPTNAYKIGDQPMLWHKGVTSNLLIGIGAGNALPLNTTNRNVFIGGNAGFNATILANRVTNTGYESGFNDGGAGSSFYGWRSGYSNTSGDFNTFIGGQAGELNTTGAANAYVGGKAGQNNNGNNNAILGFNAGLGLTNGNLNVIVGSNANTTLANLANGIALGSNAIVTNNNQMILGDNSVNVGIGLSADPAGPQNKLEIKRTNAPSFLSGYA